MFSKTSVAVLAGMALAGSVLVAPGVVAAPTAGRAAAWGYNNSGQLGNNSTTDSSVPVAVNTDGVLAGKTITAIDAGDAHTCAVADGKAYCWGCNAYGQLGNNSTTDSGVPVAVNADPGRWPARRSPRSPPAAGHSCAVADGKAFCWGYNGYGQLGDNSTTNSRVPVAVNRPGRWPARPSPRSPPGTTTRVRWPTARRTAGATTRTGNWATAAPPTRRCRSRSKPTRACWPARRSPRSPPGTAIRVRWPTGKAYCWGDNANGQLGNNSTTDSKVPVAVNTTPGRWPARRSPRSPPGAPIRVQWPTAGPSCWGYNGSRAVGQQQHHRLERCRSR